MVYMQPCLKRQKEYRRFNFFRTPNFSTCFQLSKWKHGEHASCYKLQAYKTTLPHYPRTEFHHNILCQSISFKNLYIFLGKEYKCKIEIIKRPKWKLSQSHTFPFSVYPPLSPPNQGDQVNIAKPLSYYKTLRDYPSKEWKNTW